MSNERSKLIGLAVITDTLHVPVYRPNMCVFI